MKKVLKYSIILVILIAVIIPFIVERTNADDETQVNIQIACSDSEKLEANKEYTLELKLSNLEYNVDAIILVIEYDKNVFEEITDDDLIPAEGWNYPMYNQKDSIFFIEKQETANAKQNIMSIKLKVKDDIKVTGTNVTLADIELSSEGIELNTHKRVVQTIGKNPGNITDLFLSTQEYKIGDNDTHNYEMVDEYISIVDSRNETTKAQFISNLATNGNLINIVKKDGIQLADNELVGTGMRLIVIKDDQRIELTIIVVGDVSGDGKITITDLSELNHHLLGDELQGEYRKAADLDENNEITITDLSEINHILIGQESKTQDVEQNSNKNNEISNTYINKIDETTSNEITETVVNEIISNEINESTVNEIISSGND